VKLEETALPGAFVVRPEAHEDERGLFARTYDEATFAAAGLRTRFPQHGLSYNRRTGTFRGLHWQEAPHQEAKLVRCTRGRLWDAIVDLRPGSPTRLAWLGFELSAENRLALYVPEGFAHGFVTLADDTEVAYLISAAHAPDAARGARWNDPVFGIAWPCEPAVISARDAGYEDFVP
jgi:dTDP-4-dehydrorhamnose 3,5-epimerase